MTEVMKLLGIFNLSDFIWFCKKLDLQGFKQRVKNDSGKFDSVKERIIKTREEARKQKTGSSQ